MAMKRYVRKVLDLSLVSLSKIRPPTIRLWDAAKVNLKNSRAKPLVEHPVLGKIEAGVGRAVVAIEYKMKEIRDKQLPGEIAHLEQELEKAKKRLEESKGGAAKDAKSFGALSWRYLKIEAVPPMTVNFFNGMPGRQLENIAEKLADGFIGAIDGGLKKIDAAAEEERQKVLAAAKLEEEKLIAKAKLKEAERIIEAAKKGAKPEMKKVEVAAAKPKEQPKSKPKPKDKKKKRSGK